MIRIFYESLENRISIVSLNDRTIVEVCAFHPAKVRIRARNDACDTTNCSSILSKQNERSSPSDVRFIDRAEGEWRSRRERKRSVQWESFQRKNTPRVSSRIRGDLQVRAIILARIIDCTVLSRARCAPNNETSRDHSRVKSLSRPPPKERFLWNCFLWDEARETGLCVPLIRISSMLNAVTERTCMWDGRCN